MAQRHSRFNIFSQAFREAKRPMLIWSAVMVAVVLLLLAGAALAGASLARPMPAWLALLLLGVSAQGAGADGVRAWWLAAAFNFALPVLMVIYAARQGSLLMARDEERGSLGFLLATPLPRSLLVIEKFAALLLLLIVPTAAVWLAGALTGYFDPRPALGLFLLGLAFGAPAFAIGAVTGRQALSQNVVLLAALLTFLIDRLLQNSPVEAVLRLLSPFSYYGAIRADGVIVPAAVLLGLSLLAFVIGWMVFNRRDLRI